MVRMKDFTSWEKVRSSIRISRFFFGQCYGRKKLEGTNARRDWLGSESRP